MINNISIFKFLLLIYGFNNYNTVINIDEYRNKYYIFWIIFIKFKSKFIFFDYYKFYRVKNILNYVMRRS